MNHATFNKFKAWSRFVCAEWIDVGILMLIVLRCERHENCTDSVIYNIHILPSARLRKCTVYFWSERQKNTQKPSVVLASKANPGLNFLLNSGHPLSANRISSSTKSVWVCTVWINRIDNVRTASFIDQTELSVPGSNSIGYRRLWFLIGPKFWTVSTAVF